MSRERTDFAIQRQLHWKEHMIKDNSYWWHDQNPLRPYALLTEGDISNMFANCTNVLSTHHARVITHDLWTLAEDRERPRVFCGSAYGAITLAQELMHAGGAQQAWYTEKDEPPPGQPKGTKKMVLKRFAPSPTLNSVVMVEDVITTFGSTEASMDAVRAKARAVNHNVAILPYVLCIVNRSGRTNISGFEIIAVIEELAAKRWKQGKNPFTPDGSERVPPMRPKDRESWAALTRPY